MDIQTIIEETKKYFGVTTNSALAEILSVDQSSIAKWEKRNTVQPIIKILSIMGDYNKIFPNSKIKPEYSAKMTQKQVHKVFGVTPNTFYLWSKPSNPKHNIYLILSSMTEEEALMKINEAKKRRGG